jgi:hypothetical protein
MKRGMRFLTCPACAHKGVWLAQGSRVTRNGPRLGSKWMCRYCSWWRWEDEYQPEKEMV